MSSLLALAKKYVAAGWRYRWLSLAVAWLICLGGWAAVHKLPDRYQASARIFADADLILGQTLRNLAIDGGTGQQVALLQRTLLARPNLERVIARTDLDLRVTDAASREALVTALERSVSITPQTNNLFRIAYVDEDPRLAHAVVQTVLNLFIERVTGNDRAQMENATNFINQQIAVYERQLREAEQRRAEFLIRFREILPQGATGQSQLDQARGRLAELNGKLDDLRSRRDITRRQVEATPATVAPETLAQGGGISRLAAEEARLRELRLRLTDQHPDVVAQRGLIAELRAGGGGGAPAEGAPRPAPVARSAPVPNPVREQLQVRLVDIESEIVSTERQIRATHQGIERLDALTRSVPQIQAQAADLNRDYSILLRNYEELLTRREQLTISGAARSRADQVRLEVIEPPTVPLQPVGPNRFILSVGVLAVGLGAGAALAVLLVLLDRGFYTIYDLRALGLPVLGAISPMRVASQTGAVVVFAGALSLLLVVFGVVLAGGPALVARLAQAAGIAV